MTRLALTADDVPTEPTPDAVLGRCATHPDATHGPGFGYKGGGFGPYRTCDACGEPFGKTSAKDGNQ